MKTRENTEKTENPAGERPSREEAERAVETLIRYAGENPAREGLRDTPRRVVKAYAEYFSGYGKNPRDIFGEGFEDYGEYSDFVLVRDIDFYSHCEHHMVPVIGKAHVAYWPQGRVTGISKLARIVDAYARRLTMQEKMTRQIAGALEAVLEPKGTAVMIEAAHHCMTMRGVQKSGATTVTSSFTGVFEQDTALRERFLKLVQK